MDWRGMVDLGEVFWGEMMWGESYRSKNFLNIEVYALECKKLFPYYSISPIIGADFLQSSD